jgi:hypothetical protein
MGRPTLGMRGFALLLSCCPLATGFRKQEVYIIGSALLAAILYKRRSMVVKGSKGKKAEYQGAPGNPRYFITGSSNKTGGKKQEQRDPRKKDNRSTHCCQCLSMEWLVGQYNQPPRMAAALSHFLYNSLCCLFGGFLLSRVPTHFLESRPSTLVLWLVCLGAREMPVRFSND